MRLGKETIIQIQIVNWVNQVAKVPVIHIANERQCTAQYGGILKKMGVTPGVSDLFFPQGNKDSPGLWIEVKAPGGKITELQAKFLRARIKEGYDGFIVYSFEEAKDAIKLFYGME